MGSIGPPGGVPDVFLDPFWYLSLAWEGSPCVDPASTEVLWKPQNLLDGSVTLSRQMDVYLYSVPRISSDWM